MTMRVSLLARPDHSTALYKDLVALGVDVDYHTFYAFPEKSWPTRLAPTRKTVPAAANVAWLYTALAYPVARLGRRLPINWRRLEQRLSHTLLHPRNLDERDIVHYWPFYFDRVVERLRERKPAAVTLADYYEAEPSAANTMFRRAHEAIGLPFDAPVNEQIDQNTAFEFETEFVVPSEYVRATYLAKFPRANIHVVSYGLLGRTMQERVRRPRQTRWVFVGRVCVEKGMHVLLDAFSRHPMLQLDIVGPVDHRQARWFEDRVSAMSNVRWLGPKRNSEVLALLSDYDALALPSLSDAYSIAVIEAVCAGLPVVVTTNCGVDEVVTRYGLGAVVPPANADALAAAIERVASADTTEFEAGRRTFADDEKRLPYAVRMLHLYEQLLANAE